MSHRSDVETYIKQVISGKLVTGRLQRLAVERHVHDLKHAKKRGFYFEASYPEEAIDFIETCCHHHKGKFAGQPLLLSPWQKFIVWVLFGWRQSSDDMRRFRKAFISLARKQGKTTLAAALALLLLVFDNPIEQGPEIYCVGTKEDQARILHEIAKSMIAKSPTLSKRLRVLTKSIIYDRMDGIFNPLGSDSKTLDGLNVHGVIMDEKHAWRERHRNLMEVLDSATGARDQPISITITTSGDEQSLLWREDMNYSEQVLGCVITGNIIDDTFFAFICCLDDKDDIFNEANWPKSNPNLGISVNAKFLHEKANEAKQNPVKLNAFRRYYCNLLVTSVEKAVTPEMWMMGAAPLLPVDQLGEGYGGIDLGRTDDFAAVARIHPHKREVNGEELTFFQLRLTVWAAMDGKFKWRQPPFDRWVQQGKLILCEGDSVDYTIVQDEVARLTTEENIRSWAYDDTFAKQLAQVLYNDYGIEMKPFFQTPRRYNEPTRSFLRLLRNGFIEHGNEELPAWSFGNLLIRRNQHDQWMPDKQKSPDKIDIPVASIMALDEAVFYTGDNHKESGVILL